MKLIGHIISIVAAGGVIILFLFPPWMCIDLRSEGRVHAALGYHAIWRPPSSEFVFHTLYPEAAELPDAERRADFVPTINKVQFVLSALALAIVGILSRLLLWK